MVTWPKKQREMLKAECMKGQKCRSSKRQPPHAAPLRHLCMNCMNKSSLYSLLQKRVNEFCMNAQAQAQQVRILNLAPQLFGTPRTTYDPQECEAAFLCHCSSSMRFPVNQSSPYWGRGFRAGLLKPPIYPLTKQAEPANELHLSISMSIVCL